MYCKCGCVQYTCLANYCAKIDFINIFTCFIQAYNNLKDNFLHPKPIKKYIFYSTVQMLKKQQLYNLKIQQCCVKSIDKTNPL